VGREPLVAIDPNLPGRAELMPSGQYGETRPDRVYAAALSGVLDCLRRAHAAPPARQPLARNYAELVREMDTLDKGYRRLCQDPGQVLLPLRRSAVGALHDAVSWAADPVGGAQL
jgi:hypothetical protein